MLRYLLIPAIVSLAPSCVVRSQGSGSEAAMSFTRSMSIPLNAVHLFDKAKESWTWTFGQEPGSVMKRSDREQGVIEGVARVNFRSEMLTGREETMGVIQYRIMVIVHAGECRLVISELTHIGNRNAPRGGMHCGLLTSGMDPLVKVPGMGRSNVQRLYAELKRTASDRITAVMQSFEARLRASAEP